MKKKIVIISLCVIVFLCAILYTLFGFDRISKTVSVRGYEIEVPKSWVCDSAGNLYNKSGALAGMFLLGDTKRENLSSDDMYSFVSDKKTSESVITYEGTYDNRDCVVYFIKNLPNPEPYNATLVFFKEEVADRLSKKIYKSFKMPQRGKNPPVKNIEAPKFSEVDEDKICRIEFSDGTVAVKNLKLLNLYIDKQKERQSAGVDILSYKEDDDGNLNLSSWCYIESDSGTGYMYSYYDKGDGIYTYDNDALVFDSILKESSDEKELTTYTLVSEENADAVLLEIPLNRYRDNAEELIAMKTMSAQREDIQNILNKIMSKKERESLTFDVTSNALLITYKDGIKPDRSKAYSNAAVLFSLAENLDSITFVYDDGTEYTFTRGVIDKALESTVGSAAQNKENFVDYTEKIEQTHQSQAQDGDVVYSGTVLVNYDTMVTHPKTGERVKVGPYAERKGYGQYLGKPIYCEIRRMGSAYIASASTGGNVIGSYPLNSEAELNSAINLIKAYS